MATSKKTTTKKISKKVQAMVQSDVFKSVAIASVLLNILFLVSIFVLTSTSTFDRSVYKAARNQYCKNVDGLRSRAKELGSEKAALLEIQIDCASGNFTPFYNEAIEKFKAQSNS